MDNTKMVNNGMHYATLCFLNSTIKYEGDLIERLKRTIDRRFNLVCEFVETPHHYYRVNTDKKLSTQAKNKLNEAIDFYMQALEDVHYTWVSVS